MHSTGTAPEKIRMITEKHVKKDVKSELKKKKLNTIIRKMHITTTLRYHFTATKMAKIINTDHTKCRRRCEETGTLIHHENVK